MHLKRLNWKVLCATKKKLKILFAVNSPYFRINRMGIKLSHKL